MYIIRDVSMVRKEPKHAFDPATIQTCETMTFSYLLVLPQVPELLHFPQPRREFLQVVVICFQHLKVVTPANAIANGEEKETV